MTRRLWKWDDVTNELVTPEELQHRRETRSPATRSTVAFQHVERGRWVFDRELGEIVTAAEFQNRRARQSSARSDFPCPNVLSDVQEFRNIAVDGSMISSRSQQREMMKRHGVVDVGDDKIKVPAKPEMRPAGEVIKESIEKLEAGYKPAPVESVSDWAQ